MTRLLEGTNVSGQVVPDPSDGKQRLIHPGWGGGGEMMRLLEGINCSGKVATYGSCVVPNFSVSIQKHHPCMGGDAYKAVVLQSIALK